MKWNTVAASLAAGVITIAVALAAPPPAAHAKNGDTHVTGQGIERTLDCNESTLLVNGTQNIVTALGTCWAVTVMGSSTPLSPTRSSTTSPSTAGTKRCSSAMVIRSSGTVAGN